MAEEFRLAAEDCDRLAALPPGSPIAVGPLYNQLRNRMKLIEGTIRQAAYWRQDARWFRIGPLVEELHQRIGNWLRLKVKPSPRVFELCAINMRMLHKVCEAHRTQATGKAGTILPAPLTPAARPDRSVLVRPSGLLVPATVQ